MHTNENTNKNLTNEERNKSKSKKKARENQSHSQSYPSYSNKAATLFIQLIRNHQNARAKKKNYVCVSVCAYFVKCVK